MKIYPKIYEDLNVKALNNWHEKRLPYITTTKALDYSVPELSRRFNRVFEEWDASMWDSIVKMKWLEWQFYYKGTRKIGNMVRGRHIKPAYSGFLEFNCNISANNYNSIRFTQVLPTYFPDWFPEFLHHDPWEDPKSFKYPYKNLNLLHPLFVYRVENRLELLEYANKKHMTYQQFVNFSTNQVLCYNDEVGEVVYWLGEDHSHEPIIFNKNRPRNWFAHYIGRITPPFDPNMPGGEDTIES